MKKVLVWGAALGLALSATPTWAQGRAQAAKPSQNRPEGRGPGGPEGRGPGRRMRGPKMGLERLWNNVGQLSGANAVTQSQAKKMVALVRPWGSKPSMSDADATALTAKLNATLTAAQKSELEKMRPGPRGGRGPGGPREGREGRGPREGGGPGGPPPGGFGGREGGPPPEFDRSKMEAMRTQMEGFRKTVNPFYPPSKYSQVKAMPEFMRGGMQRRYDESQATLKILSRKAG